MAESARAIQTLPRTADKNVADPQQEIEPFNGAGLALTTEQTGVLATSTFHTTIFSGLALAGAIPLMRPRTWPGFLVRLDLEAHLAARSRPPLPMAPGSTGRPAKITTGTGGSGYADRSLNCCG